MDYLKDKFPLSHVVLYAKGWYERTNDLYEDLKKMLHLDDYLSSNKRDIMNVILLEFRRYNDWRKENKLHYYEWEDIILMSFDRSNGTFKKMDYDKALLKEILQCFASFNQFVLPVPHYEKGTCMPGVNSGTTYKEMNSIAMKAFDARLRKGLGKI